MMDNKIAKNILDTDHNQDIETKADEENKTIQNIGIAHGLRETVDRYGFAIAEDYVAYSGQRLNADGSITSYQKSHSKIATHKINPEYYDNNVAQQAGFNAEVHYISNKNKENIINKDKTRYSRTDDIKNSDGSSRINDTVADIAQLDEYGNVIAGSEGQMKFVKDPKELGDKIVMGEGGGKNDLSRYQGSKLILPDGQVNDVKSYYENEAKKLEAKAKKAINDNDAKSAKTYSKQAKKYQNQGREVENFYKDRAEKLKVEIEKAKQSNNPNLAEKYQKKVDEYNKLANNKDLKTFYNVQSEKLKEQANKIESSKPELAQKKLEQAQKYEELANNLESAGFTSEKAKAYRLNPISETAKSITGTAHDAGLQGAKYGAAIGGAISMANNIIAVMQDKKEIGDALIDCTVDTTKAAAMAYGTTFAGAAVKGTVEQAYGVLQQNAINKATEGLKGKAVEKAKDAAIEVLKDSNIGKIALKASALSKTALPALALTVCLELGGLIRRYSKGDIDGVQFMEQIGEKGVGLVASSSMAVIGQIAIPIPVVGAVIGGMIGYTLSSMFYNEALSAFKGAKEAHANYLLIKAQYEEAKRQRDIYRAEMRRLFDEHMHKQQEMFALSFQQIDLAVESGDMTSFATEINNMGEMFGKQLHFSNRNEFDDFMKSNNTLVL